MILIGLHGMVPQIGKDTAFKAIEEWAYSKDKLAMRRGFADDLKISALVSLGVIAKVPTTEAERQAALDLADEIKLHGFIEVTVERQHKKAHKGGEAAQWYAKRLSHITGRELFRYYGTEGHRSIFGDDIWVDQLLPRDEGYGLGYQVHDWEWSFRNLDSKEMPQIAVITDVRFPNEADRIHGLGGEVWAIRWPEREQAFLEEHDAAQIHVSDLLLPAKYIDREITNGDSVGAFQGRVRTVMSEQFSDHVERATRRRKADIEEAMYGDDYDPR